LAQYSKDNFLIILISPSGGGKTTLGNMILDEFENVDYSVSYTTRPARKNEKHGESYFFVSESKFKGMILLDEFLEYAQVHGFWYGTSKKYIEKKNKENKHVLMDIDVQGSKLILDSGYKAVTIFLLPPSEQILETRLKERGTDSQEVISTRLQNAKEEIKQIKDFQYLVINDDLNEAFEQIKSIISSEENRFLRYNNITDTFYGG
jgi:guanylate kinase